MGKRKARSVQSRTPAKGLQKSSYAGIIHGNAAACLPQLPYQVLQWCFHHSSGLAEGFLQPVPAQGLSKFGTDFLGSFQATSFAALQPGNVSPSIGACRLWCFRRRSCGTQSAACAVKICEATPCRRATELHGAPRSSTELHGAPRSSTRHRTSPSLTLRESFPAASSASDGTTTLRLEAYSVQATVRLSASLSICEALVNHFLRHVYLLFQAISSLRGKSAPGWQTEPTWCCSRPAPRR